VTAGALARVPDAELARGDARHCRAWIAEHSRSFFLSSLLLPARARAASWALYAFCRRADDAVDTGGDDEARLLRRVANLRARLDRVYGDRAASSVDPVAELADPVDRAFARVALASGIPRGVPEALLAGMEMDARGARYATWDDLLLYCFRVASTVGLMMTRAMTTTGGRAPRRDTMLRAAELGVAMQLTNIARDVGEDARRGRVYLPDALLDECGTERAAVLAAREASAPIREATRRLLLRADDFYRSAERGIALLPLGCRPAIASSRYIYAAIGDEIARAGHDSVTRRAHTSLGRKLLLVGRALGASLARARPEAEGPADALLCAHIRATGIAVMGDGEGAVDAIGAGGPIGNGP
jgi:phytoene synthase